MAASVAPSGSTPQLCKGVVKQVLSGDAVIVRAQPKGGPPPEKQINFSNVIAPRVGRRGAGGQQETSDEPYAWESREYLRQKLIGKDVLFTVETKTNTGREYGTVYLGKNFNSAENMTETMVSEGLVTVRKENIRGESKLVDLEEQARQQNKGKWAGMEDSHIRNMPKPIDIPRQFVDKMKGVSIKAIVEHVRDGSTVRVLLLPDFHTITLMISGIRCPMFKLDSEGKPDKTNAESYAEEARYFVESRLLQRDVEVILETVSNNNFVGTIKHPQGNIAEALLKEGFAKCVTWSLATVTGRGQNLVAAEKIAKEKRLRLWVDHKPEDDEDTASKETEITGMVVEVVNGDALMVQPKSGEAKKLFLSSIRPPRLTDSEGNQKPLGRNVRIYDIPWLFEAREFLRKKLIGQKVRAVLDYIQPAQNNLPERVCCSVFIGDINVAEALVSKGLATVIRYRQDDDQRSHRYDDLLSAEAKASKGGKGLHSKKDVPIHRITDLSGDPSKGKSYLPFLLKKQGQVEGIVEFVASGSRVRLFIPKENCIVTFLLAGINCPRAARPTPGGDGMTPEDPFGNEAQVFTKNLVLQREVQVEVDTMDKGGNFIGWLTVDGKNLSVLLVEEGLSSVHPTAEGSRYYPHLQAAEKSAKSKKLKLWSSYVEESKQEKIEEVDQVRKEDFKLMVISEVTRSGTVFGQLYCEGPQLEKMMENLREEFRARPPFTGAHTPRRGDLIAAKFSDGDWYRAKVEKVAGHQVHVFYVDYGNREVTTAAKLAPLPAGFLSQKPFAHEMAVAFVKFPLKDEEDMDEAIQALSQELTGPVNVNKEYIVNGMEYALMLREDTKADVGKSLVSKGYIFFDPRSDKKLLPVTAGYKEAEVAARQKRLQIWRYGDNTEDEAFEFGMER